MKKQNSSLDDSARYALAEMSDDEPAQNPAAALPKDARDHYAATFSHSQLALEDVAEVQEIYVTNIRVKIWRGQDTLPRSAPALLYLHGGGWVVGSPETHEDICRTIANRVGAVVFSPDYRLAPEHPFPAGIDDCAEVLSYIKVQAQHLGVDSTRIAVGGDSAGGNIATILALLAGDRKLPKITAQLLLYPVTDMTQSSSSYEQYAQGYGLTAEAMRWSRGHYLSNLGQINDWRASPLLVSSMENVAPAFVGLAGCDVLYDEGKAYASDLAKTTQVIEQTWPGQIHGFASMGEYIPEAKEVLSALCRAWQKLDPKFDSKLE